MFNLKINIMKFYKMKTILDTKVGDKFYINIDCALACRETQSFLVSLQALVYSLEDVNSLKDKSSFLFLERISSKNQPDSFNIGFLEETKFFFFSEKAFNERKKDPKFLSSLDFPVFQYLVFQDFDASDEGEEVEDEIVDGKQEESLKNSDEKFKEILDDGLTKTPDQLDQEFEGKNNSSSNKQGFLEEGGQSLKKEQNLSSVKEKSEVNEDLSVVELEKKLVEALAKEDYEEAAQLRDLIEKAS